MSTASRSPVLRSVPGLGVPHGVVSSGTGQETGAQQHPVIMAQLADVAFDVPRMKPGDVEEFLRQPHVGVLATLRRDGRPYTVPVWFLHDGGNFWISGTYERVWCKQLLADARASLCVEAMAPVAGHVGVDGRAVAHELPDLDIWPNSRRLVDKYVGPEHRDAFFANMQTEHRLLFELVPEVFRAIDMRVYRGKRADRDYQDRRATSA
jgi:PPOX class probable F420-dependent enzyme